MVLKWNQYHILNRIKNIANITMEYLSISLMNSLYRSSSSSICLYIISISSPDPPGLPGFISLRALEITSCIEVWDGAEFGIGCNVIGSKLDPHRLPATMEEWITFRLFLRIFTSSKKGHKYISSSHIYGHILNNIKWIYLSIRDLHTVFFRRYFEGTRSTIPISHHPHTYFLI